MMKWFAKLKKPDPDDRIKSGFLVFPKSIRGERRWLEHATWREHRSWYGGWEDTSSYWECTEWLDGEVTNVRSQDNG